MLKRTTVKIDPGPVRSERLLMVEGPNDAVFYEAALQHLKLSPEVEVRFSGGSTALTDRLRAVLAISPDIRVVAAIQDAGNDPATRFTFLAFAVANAGLAAPDAVGKFGQLASGRQAGILVVPADRPGGLEAVCWESVQNQAVPRLAEHFVEDTRTAHPHWRPATPEQDAKQLVGTLLGIGVHSHSKPEVLRLGLRLGEAAMAGVWDWHHPALSPILTFLTHLAAL